MRRAIYKILSIIAAASITFTSLPLSSVRAAAPEGEGWEEALDEESSTSEVTEFEDELEESDIEMTEESEENNTSEEDAESEESGTSEVMESSDQSDTISEEETEESEDSEINSQEDLEEESEFEATSEDSEMISEEELSEEEIEENEEESIEDISEEIEDTEESRDEAKGDKHIITYVLNEGEFANDYVAVCFFYEGSGSFILPKDGEVIKEGFYLRGWCKDKALKTTPVKSISRQIKNDLKLYAKWEPMNYKVVLHSNYGTDQTKEKTLGYEQEYLLSDSLFTRPGYELIEWQEKVEDKMLPVGINRTIKGYTMVHKKEIHFYAKWRAIPYDIKYHLNGAAIKYSGYQTQTDAETTLITDMPELSVPYGYSFEGWYFDVNYKKPVKYNSQNQAILSGGMIGSLDLYAKVVAKTYRVIFMVYNPSTGYREALNIEEQTHQYGEEVKTPKCPIKIPGYAFAGWEFKTGSDTYEPVGSTYVLYPDKNKTEDTYNLTADDGMVVLWAKFDQFYNYTLKSEGQPDITGTNMYGVKMDFPNPKARTGYTLVGWKDVSTGKKVSKIYQNSGRDAVYEAIWKENSYTLVYRKNAKEVTGSVKKVTMTHSEFLASTKKIAYSGFERKGYILNCWNLVANPTEENPGFEMYGNYGLNVYTRNLFNRYNFQDGENIILYAQWKEYDYHIEYVTFANVSTADFPATYKYGETLKLPVPEAPGLEFQGWYLDEYFKHGIKTIKADAYGDIKVYAKWSLLDASKAEKITVYFHPGEATMAGNTYMENSEIGWQFDISRGITANQLYGENGRYRPEKKHYIFDGWYREPEFKHKVNSVPANTPGGMVLYAKYIPKSFVIAYVAAPEDELNLPAGFEATGRMGKMRVKYGEYRTLSDCAFQLKGYKFKQWDKYPFAPNKEFLTDMINPNEDPLVIVKAKWVPVEYKINYYNTEGVISSGFQPTENWLVYYKTKELIEPQRPGYTFLGWYADAKFRGKPVTEIKTGTARNIKLYARWKMNK